VNMKQEKERGWCSYEKVKRNRKVKSNTELS